ncbi:RNA polymerase sigma factor, sigma-70 family [Aeromicrobium marinum DSM 15272]|uniref:RNA polymerase sigma factor, sigma-70 family n=1 Tax=Aeromicrobium marinum DSM 15272 TaxID=585531 RepID=E2SFX4_9ACTN|nr:hypothetical protein [Aeromicrobium marinum]EFQ81921.1 RNA polymerase sigma factor, sigma-70 family [Aeromicrobium marinum DSM 15272]
MTRVDEFDSFYRSTSDAALRVTYAVTGDRTVAREVTVDAYRRAWRDWSKIRDRHALSYVRNEAWKLAVLDRGTHPLRRRHEDDSDTELLDALADLPSDDRRLIVLMTLGSTDLDDAAREVGVTDEDGIEKVTSAITALEAATGQDIDTLERRMLALVEVAQQLSLPPSDHIRRKAVQGRRRNTVALVAAAVTALAFGGVVATEGDVLATGDVLPDRQRFGAETPDLVLDAREIDAGNLLTSAQVSQLDPEAEWTVTSTDEDTDNDRPYATCPTQRFATVDPLKVFVRSFEGSGRLTERVAQAIEVAPGVAAAEEAYARLVSWYADCSHPRTQLTETYRVARPFGDFLIMRMVSNRSPQRTFTVGFSQSGTVTSTVVHEVDGLEAPPIEVFAQTLNDSVERVCADSGGRCTDDIQVQPTDPPRTSEAPEFLGVVDLPPITTIDNVWAGVAPTGTGPNPAATPCDRSEIAGEGVTGAGSRIYVIPEATGLPPGFGAVETVGRFASEEAATAFVDDVRNRIAACPGENLAAGVEDTGAFDTGVMSRGFTWRIGFEVADAAPVSVRTAIVQRGSAVAQLTFTPSGEADVSPEQFLQLAQRAAQRLIYLP